MSAPSSRPVVVGVDGSESALAATRWAAAEAQRRGAPLRLVTVYEWTRDVVVGHPALGERFREDLQAAAERRMGDAVSAAREVSPGRPIASATVNGSPIGALTEEANYAQLVVLGSRGLGGLGGLLLGSVAVALAARAACPVVVVRGTDRADDRTVPVVVGVDHQPAGDAAIEFAFDAAAARGAPLVAVHAWADVVYDPQVVALTDRAAIQEHERTALTRRLSVWAEKYPAVALSQVVFPDSPSRALVAWSKDAQLLVVGSRGRGNLAGLVLGSVSHSVLQHSRCPVVVARAAAG